MTIEQNFFLPKKIQELIVKSSEIKKLELKVKNAESLIKDHCCLNSIKEEISSIDKVASKILSSYNKAIIVAIGGAMSSSRAFAACKNYQSENFQLIYSDSMNEQRQNAIFTKGNLQESAIIVISRSGETAETISQFRIIIDKYYKYFGDTYPLGKHFFVITEGSNTLQKIANSIEANIYNYICKTGKFSVFSMVGLLPAKLIGFSPEEIIDGAMETLGNPRNAMESAWLNYQLLSMGYNINVLSHYNDMFDYLLIWCRQVSSEIVAKDGKGFSSMVAGAFDQHGLWQLFLSGPSDKYFTFLSCSDNKDNVSKINRLIEKTYYQINLKRLEEKGEPVRELIIKRIDSKYIGALIMQFVLEFVLVADLLSVSSTTHPDIERSKRLVSKAYSLYSRSAKF